MGGTDLKPYMGFDQSKIEVVDYYVDYSCNGGADWVAAGTNCAGKAMSCEITGLPAGTPCMFRVRAGSIGGWGEESQVEVMQTMGSPASLACSQQLLSQADGSYVNAGTIVAVVAGVIAILLIIGCFMFMIKRRQPPPPPPGGFDKAAP